MKIYNINPEGNEMADLAPAAFFSLAVEKINKYEMWLRTSDTISQPLLVHIDIFLILADKYPSVVQYMMDDVDREKIKSTFFSWFERVEKKIPAKFREGIKESAIDLFKRLDAIKAF